MSQAPARIRCFLLEPVELERIHLRRFCWDGNCPQHNGRAHRARVKIYEGPIGSVAERSIAETDPRWPAACSCGYAFAAADQRVVDYDQLYKRGDTGQLLELHEAPDGAIHRATWLEGNPEWCGPDGQSWICRVPSRHDWMIDSRASNCDSPCKTCGVKYSDHNKKKPCDRYVDARPHKCWVRSGIAPALSAGKGAKGQSCTAGGGSILTPEYHGHLVKGELVRC